MKNNGIPKYYQISDLCGNCWGIQEYAGVIKRFRYDRKTDFDNHLKKRSFIEEFVYKYLPRNSNGLLFYLLGWSYKNLIKDNGNEGRIGIVNKRSV